MERGYRGQGHLRGALGQALVVATLLACDPREESVQLSKQTAQEREIKAGEHHDYDLVLEAGQLVEIVVNQLGIDVAVALEEPGGDRVLEVDSPTGRHGRERLVAVAEAAGTYRVVVRAVEEDAPAGSYRLAVAEQRPATAEDRRRAAAEKTFALAELRFMAGGPEALREAVGLYEEVKAEWVELGHREREADTLLRLGWAHGDLKERAQAITSLEAAQKIYGEIDQGAGQGLALNSLGGIWIQLHENREALRWVEQAVALGRKIDDPAVTAAALTNLGALLDRQGKTDAAIDAYDEARKLYAQLGVLEREARILNNLGLLLTIQGKLMNAGDHLQKAADIWEKLDQPAVRAIALTALGDVRQRQEKFEDALRNLEEALVLRRRVDDRDGEGWTLNFLGTTRLRRGEFDQARACYEQASAIFKESGKAQGQAVTLVNLGRLNVEIGDPKKALELHHQASELIDAASEPMLAASNLYGTAKALHDMGDFEAARRQLEETLDKVEKLRAATTNEGLRIAFFATRQHYYDLYIDILMHLGADEAAFEASERRRARGLLEILGEELDGIRENVSQELVERERLLQARLNELEKRRIELLHQSASEESKLEETRKQQRAAVFELEEVRGELNDQVISTRPAQLADIQELLTPGTVGSSQGSLMLVYSLGDERSFLFCVSHEKLETHVLPGRQTIELLAHDAHRSLTKRKLGDGTRLPRILAELSEILLGPIAAELDRQQLVIVAEGALLQLAFAVLPGPAAMKDPPDYLVRRHETIYLPSASVLRNIRERIAKRPPAPKQLAIFADPIFTRDKATEGTGESGGIKDKALRRSVEVFGMSQLAPLPYTRDEAEAILEVARGECLRAFDYDATKAKVLSGQLDRYRILHFATHGLIHREQPELSGLVLALYNRDGQPIDGFLRLHEIYNLRLSADIVVLSACETGGGEVVKGEGILGLTRGFLHAGASRLVVSLWNVSDKGTAELMKRFYWNLLEGKAPPPRALRVAQCSMLAETQWEHPYYWAGFVFQGEWRPPGAKPPIGALRDGAVALEPSDPGYPGSGKKCEDLPEEWMRKLCKLLRESTGG